MRVRRLLGRQQTSHSNKKSNLFSLLPSPLVLGRLMCGCRRKEVDSGYPSRSWCCWYRKTYQLTLAAWTFTRLLATVTGDTENGGHVSRFMDLRFFGSLVLYCAKWVASVGNNTQAEANVQYHGMSRLHEVVTRDWGPGCSIQLSGDLRKTWISIPSSFIWFWRIFV